MQDKSMDKQLLANRLQFSAWTSIFIFGIYFWFVYFSRPQDTDTLWGLRDWIIILTKWAQLLQATDFMSKGKLLPKVLQWLGRNGVAWFILPLTSNLLLPMALIMMWAFGDIIRYRYYLNPGYLEGVLRYNVFIVLYPVGLTFEFLNMWDVYWNHWTPSKGVAHAFEILVAIQALMVPGLIFNYRNLLKFRRDFYRKQKAE